MWKISLTLFALLGLTLPSLSTAAAITDADVDRFLKSVPPTSESLKQIKARIESEKDLSKALTMAQLEGRLHREMVKLSGGWPEQDELKEQVKQTGFNSIEQWALIADRIMGVISSAQWVVAAASMPIPNSDEPTLAPDTNLFAYLDDETNDTTLVQKYDEQLGEMCERLCYDSADLPVVGARYDEIKTMLKRH